MLLVYIDRERWSWINKHAEVMLTMQPLHVTQCLKILTFNEKTYIASLNSKENIFYSALSHVISRVEFMILMLETWQTISESLDLLTHNTTMLSITLNQTLWKQYEIHILLISAQKQNTKKFRSNFILAWESVDKYWKFKKNISTP